MVSEKYLQYSTTQHVRVYGHANVFGLESNELAKL